MVCALITADYLRKYHTGRLARAVFLAALAAAQVRMICGAAMGGPAAGRDGGLDGLDSLGGLGGGLVAVRILAWASHLAAVYLLWMFVDYQAFRDTGRTRRVAVVTGLAAALSTILVAWAPAAAPFALALGYGPLALMAAAAVIGFATPWAAPPYAHDPSLVAVLAGLIGAGTALDYALETAAFTAPLFTAALLYAYFFVIRTESTIDSLTGIGNRYALNEFMSRLSRQAAGERYALVMIDMDHFKAINDQLGHAEGDNALRDMAVILKSCIRRSDFAARYGGDEFILALPAGHDIGRIIERIQRAIDTQNARGGRPYRIGMSYGWDVLTTGRGAAVGEFIKHIDDLMYRNKEDHRRAEPSR